MTTVDTPSRKKPIPQPRSINHNSPIASTSIPGSIDHSEPATNMAKESRVKTVVPVQLLQEDQPALPKPTAHFKSYRKIIPPNLEQGSFCKDRPTPRPTLPARSQSSKVLTPSLASSSSSVSSSGSPLEMLKDLPSPTMSQPPRPHRPSSLPTSGATSKIILRHPHGEQSAASSAIPASWRHEFAESIQNEESPPLLPKKPAPGHPKGTHICHPLSQHDPKHAMEANAVKHTFDVGLRREEAQEADQEVEILHAK